MTPADIGACWARRTGAAGAVLGMLLTACSATDTGPPLADTPPPTAQPPMSLPGPTTSTAGAPVPERAPGGDGQSPLPGSPSPRDGASDGVDAAAPAAAELSLDADPPACAATVAPGTPGVTDAEMAVGVPRFRNVAAVTTGLEPPEAQLHEYVGEMVDHVNSTGGIACRQVRVVWHDMDLASWQATWGPASEQSMCATWTQDDPVFAAFPGGLAIPFDVLYPCLDRAGVAIVDVRGVSYRDRGGFEELPRLLAVNAVRLDRGSREQIDALVRRGFLTDDTRIGVVYYDSPPELRTIERAVIPALAEHGLSLAARRAVTPPTSASEVAERDRDAADAALRFKLAGIDRVLFVRGSGLAARFMQAAEGNQYRPRYGLTTVELPAVLDAPHQQLEGALGIGWLPDPDLSPQRPTSWPARSACLGFFHDRGFRTATTLDRLFALSVCDAFWFVRAATEAAPGPLSTDAVTAGALELRSSYRSPTVERTRFDAGKRDGAAEYRDVGYDPDCACFAHTGSAHPVR